MQHFDIQVHFEFGVIKLLGERQDKNCRRSLGILPGSRDDFVDHLAIDIC
jgi:hypothetical protein